CMLCHRVEADPVICGNKLERRGLCVHQFCLLLANKRFRQRSMTVGLMGFRLQDIRGMIKRAARKQCFVCGERGATITCRTRGCRRSFHLPCAVKGECVTRFVPEYRSFCSEHRPQQAVEVEPQQDTTCLICLEPVGDRISYTAMVCPACKSAWFHRGCIQGQAASAGVSCFQCPLCRDTWEFMQEMVNMGIRVPFRDPTWENQEAYAELGEKRHGCCDASECLCPGGREQAEEEEGPWQLLLCCSCAGKGTHRRCSHLESSMRSWECNSCA
ncbi:PHD finger protein 7, partial [Mesitornis unicolor]